MAAGRRLHVQASTLALFVRTEHFIRRSSFYQLFNFDTHSALVCRIMAPPGLSGSGSQPSKSGQRQRKDVPKSSASHPSGITKRQRKNMNRLQKAGKPIKSAEEYRAQLEVKLADQDRGIARRQNPIVKDNVPADCALECLRRDKPSLYASITTGSIPMPAKDDPQSARVIWFNDLNNKFTFNRHFTQGKMLSQHARDMALHCAQSVAMPLFSGILSQARFSTKSASPLSSYAPTHHSHCALQIVAPKTLY